MEKISEYLIRSTISSEKEVRAWSESIMLPTYEAGAEEKNPIFLEKRVYQGSSGAVYPYPVVETISDVKRDKPYRAYFIENKYLKLMILPELGGRVQMAYDKLRQRHFVYYNQVVKPALVGLTGPWISGGIEFNWPQHHRPSTFLPVDCSIEQNSDGSKTVWCNEVERMTLTRGSQGFTLYTDRAYLEVNVKIYNRTPFPQTFLWWANPAVSVNEHYYSVFPPDVHAVFDHGRRDVSKFPIATGLYYKHDYSPGIDISRYRNIPVPTSYMAVHSRYDFVGGYDEQAQAGLLHVADHHLSPGKKQWTWGNGDFGRAWDRNLTDEDGPYIELMTGVYTDNQPDFSWLHPYEEKAWKQYFMPYAAVGRVKNATKDAVINVEVEGGTAKITVYTTAEYQGLRLRLLHHSAEQGDKSPCCLLDTIINVSPAVPYRIETAVGEALAEDLTMELRYADGGLLIDYRAAKFSEDPLPEPARAAGLPKEISSVEQLFLTGMHLEQYRHATYHPMDYYAEALRREPDDVRSNNAAGLWLLRRGQFAQAEQHFRRAAGTLTQRNPNPYDGEIFYNLGCCLKMQDREAEAYDSFYKATWNAAWRDAAYLALAQIEASRAAAGTACWTSALDKAESSLLCNANNHKSRQLKASALRRLGRIDQARKWIEASLSADGFNLGCHLERYLLTDDRAAWDAALQSLGNRVNACMEYALDFAAAGMYSEAEMLLAQCLAGDDTYPMAYYALAYCAARRGASAQASGYYSDAARTSPAKCFPFRLEEVNILRAAICANPADAKAPYYLGNFLYASRIYAEAIECWERSALLDDAFPTVKRNLALAYCNKLGKKQAAIDMLEQAFALDSSDARVLMELDGLYKRTGARSPAERLAFLESHASLVEQRDDLCIERITLYNDLADYRKARELIAARKFHPWEGGEGKVTGEYVRCRLEPAKLAIADGRFADALTLLCETDVYPENLGEGKLPTMEENELDYYKGVAYRGVGDEDSALRCFVGATRGESEPALALFYNDAQPERIFYQGLAWRALGDEERASLCFEKLVRYADEHINDDCRIDYFAVSLPDLAVWDDDMNERNRRHCSRMRELGITGAGMKSEPVPGKG